MSTRLGRYELIRPLGEGGMGVVHEAVLHGPGGFRKPVALKVLKEGGAGLAREARLGGLLQHPNLVEVYALEQIDGEWACAMELVRGGNLWRREALPPKAVVEVGRQVCAGLQHAHERIGLVHLDLKPSNLLVEGLTVKIADLGVARARGFSERSRVRGTPAYMSPEQAGGGPVDHRSDLYSLGICLYELATGRLPAVDSGAAETWSTVDDADGVWVGTPALDAVPWLAPVLERCLAAAVEDRYQSAEELAAALDQLDVDGPGLAEALGVESAMPARRTGSSTGTLTRRAPTETNLGAEVDAFVGRQPELDQLDREVHQHGLVTLKGAGGSGKTRLARRFGERWRRRTGGQSWFVDLSAARTRFDVVSAVAQTLKIPMGSSSEHGAAVKIGHALAGREGVLLILDNYEQVTDCADLAGGWASADPSVRVLVTSREPLRLRSEVVVAVDPLPEADAVSLLVARARDRGMDVVGDPALPELARRLDGLPLALELAAGRMTLLSPAQVLDRLDQRLKLLGGGARGGRQATLRATLDWSWELLGPDERDALAQLSVFRGGFSLELAEAVVQLGGGAWVLDALTGLADRSLLVVRALGEDARFDLLESVRVFAAEKLGARAAGAEVRHGRALAELERDRRNRTSFGFVGWRRLEREVDNLVAACQRAIARGDGDVGARTAVAVAEVLELRGPYRVLAELCDGVAELELTPHHRGLIQLVTARARWRLGRKEGVLELVSAACGSFVVIGEPHAEADALNLWGTLLRQSGDPRGALEKLRASEALYTQVADPRSAAMVWGNIGACHFTLGEIDEARAMYQRALQTRRQLGDRRGEGHLLGSLAAVEQMAGKNHDAAEHYRAALRLHRDLGDKRSESLCLANLGVLAVDRGQFDKAERRWGEAIEIRRTIGDRHGMASLMGYLSMLRIERGDLDGAATRTAEAIELNRTVGRQRQVATLTAQLGGVQLLQGQLAEARELLSAAREGHVAAGDRIALGITAVLWGRLCRAEGDLEGALRSFEAAVDAVAGRHVPSEAEATAWRGWARVATGDLEGGREDLDRARRLLASGRYHRCLADVLSLRFLALGDREALDEAVALDRAPDSPSGRLVAEALAEAG